MLPELNDALLLLYRSSVHFSALGTILSTVAIAAVSMSGDKKAPAPVEQQTNIEASSR
jgi:hypothetical protein